MLVVNHAWRIIMSLELNSIDNPITWEAAALAKKTLMYFSYGEFDGFKKPSVAELRMVKGAINGAIAELSKQDMDNLREA